MTAPDQCCTREINLANSEPLWIRLALVAVALRPNWSPVLEGSALRLGAESSVLTGRHLPQDWHGQVEEGSSRCVSGRAQPDEPKKRQGKQHSKPVTKCARGHLRSARVRRSIDWQLIERPILRLGVAWRRAAS
jgi:hypothetical protein